MSAGFAIPILLGAALGFLALRQAPEVVTLSVLALTGGALTGGALTAVVVEEIRVHRRVEVAPEQYPKADNNAAANAVRETVDAEHARAR